MADISKVQLPSGDTYDIKDTYARDRTVYAEEKSGNLVTISDGADNFPVPKLIANINLMQTGTGTPSTTNVMPISGFASAIIRRTGKNLWGGDALLDDIQAAIPSAVVYDETHTINLVSSYTATNPLCGIHNGMRRGFQFAENTRYTFIFTMYRTGTASNMRVTYTDGTYDNIPAAPELETKGTVVFVSDAGKTVEKLNKIQNSGTVTIYADESGIFEGVLTAEDFVPYDGTEVTVAFPSEAGVVYGGTLDVTTGTLTVTWAKQQITTVTGANGNKYAYTRLGAKDSIESYEGLCNILVNKGSAADMQEGEFTVVNSSGYNQGQAVYVLPGMTGTTAAEFKASAQSVLDELMNNGIIMEVAYKLTSPIVYQIPPTQISTLPGIINIYVNTGNILKLIYARDTFDSIAQIVNGMLSVNAYSLSISGSRITLSSNSGDTSYVDLPVYDGTVI